MKKEGLERFVNAQEHDFARALQEIKNGRKTSHWMWYIFPQIQGLGHSPTARYYAVKDQKEADAYMKHPVLGSRLLEISGELLKLNSCNATEIFGWPDDMKLKSAMTLFEAVSGEPVFGSVLDKFFDGRRDPYTLDFLNKETKASDQKTPHFQKMPLKQKEGADPAEDIQKSDDKFEYTVGNHADLIRESAAKHQIFGGRHDYTLEDYEALPEDMRVELIDGQFFEMFAPTLGHQAVSMELSFQIRDFIRKKKGNCSVFAAPADVQLDGDDRTIVQPDVMIICEKKKLSKKRVVGAPDFIAEILSPSTKQKDMFLKLMKYKNAGVREYWMIDLEKERIITYDFEEDDIPVIHGMEETIPVKIFGGELVIDFSEIKNAAEGLAL